MEKKCDIKRIVRARRQCEREKKTEKNKNYYSEEIMIS